jgi:hypothetical protein
MIKSKTVTWEGNTYLAWGETNAFKIFVRKDEGT